MTAADDVDTVTGLGKLGVGLKAIDKLADDIVCLTMPVILYCALYTINIHAEET